MFQRTLLISLCASFVTIPTKVSAAGKVIILSLSRTSVQQLADNEDLAPWLAKSSVGLLNTGTAGTAVGRHLYVTMGAGSRALGTDSTGLAFLQEEDYHGTAAKTVFARHQGAAASGQVVHIGMADLIQANKALNHAAQPGLLGDCLHAAGKKTAVIGNADANQINREAAAMLADSRGEIDFGQVGTAVLTSEPMFPYGCGCISELVWQTFSGAVCKSDVLLIDWGDTAV